MKYNQITVSFMLDSYTSINLKLHAFFYVFKTIASKKNHETVQLKLRKCDKFVNPF